ncbi:MAG: hypothetical protein ACKOWO_05490 [Sediminibacterium sp.]
MSQTPKLEGTTPFINIETRSGMHLNGAVKSMSETSYKAALSNGKYVKGAKGWQYSWDCDNNYQFDTNGNLLLQKKLKDGAYKTIRAQTFDSLGRLIKSVFFERKSVYTYDSIGQLKQVTEINTENNKTIDVVYFYSNNLVSQIHFITDKTLHAIEAFQYDQNGNCTAAIYQTNDYKTIDYYTYNSSNQLIKYVGYEDDDPSEREEIYYTYEGTVLIQENNVGYSEGEIYNELIYKYKDGFKVEVIETYLKTNEVIIETYTYEFDAQGNWIKKYINDNGKYYIVERTFVYYP